tara:strand:+ start:94 stop:3549 length:3456 start_codon:yes stop_codon:yes gene_type:complete
MSNARNIGDSAPVINFLDNVTSDVQTQLNTLDTAIGNVSVTSGSLTKTFAADETATITLSGNVLAPVVTATKEVAQTGVTNNDWDAAAASYTLENSAPSTTLDFVGYDVSSASFVDSFSISAQETEPEGIAFNTDGTKMYVIGTTGDDVNEYTLSTGFDVSTATYSQNFDVSSQETEPKGIAFNTDGSKMFIVGTSGTDVNEYNLSTGFDVSTSSYSQNFSVSSQEASPQDVAFNTDGTKMFILGNTGVDVNEYTLSTGFDVSTASYSQNFSISGQESYPRGLTFNTDGTKMFVVGNSADKVSEYALSTGFDVSTASYSQNFDVGAQDTVPRGIAFNASGTTMFILGSTGDDVNEYTIAPSSVTLGTGSFASGDVGKCIEANSGKFVLISTGGAITITTTPSSYNQVSSGSWQMYALVYNSTTDVIETSNFAQGFDISSITYNNVSGYVGSQAALLEGVFLKPDGTKMYVTGQNNDQISEYTLSTPNDPSTLTHVSSFSVSSQEAEPHGVFFKSDGTKVFIIGQSDAAGAGSAVRGYDLSTAWQISTASYSSERTVLFSTDAYPKDLWISDDGTLLFWVGAQTNYVYKYTMSTAWDVSTAISSQSLNIGPKEAYPEGLALSSDGKNLFHMGNEFDKINRWAMSTAFDLTTAVWQEASELTEDSTPTSISFNSDGTTMLLAGGSNARVYGYSTKLLYAATGYQPAIGSTIDSTYWTDLNSMTATNAVGDGNVFYAISNDGKTNWSILDNTSGVRKIVKNNGGTYQVNTNSTYGSETWADAATNTEVAALREAMTSAIATVGFAPINTATYVQHYNSGSQSVQPSGVAFKADGTKMYVLSVDPAGIVYQYSLSTAWDISTASYDSVSLDANTAGTGGTTYGINFKTDGTKLYISERTNQRIHEFALSTAWDISTASYTDYFATGMTQANGFCFSPDGTKMTVASGSTHGGGGRYFTLSTAWDVSTGTSGGDIGSVGSTIRDCEYNADGTKIYFLEESFGGKVMQHSLSTAYDSTTQSADSLEFALANPTNPQGIAFGDSGTKMYAVDVDTSTDGVYQYTTSTTENRNQMTSTELNAINDASQITLGTALDLATIIYYASGSTTPTYSGTAINYDANVLNQGAILGTDYTYDAPAQNKVRVTSVNAANLKIRVV